MAGQVGGKTDFSTFNFTYSGKKRTGAMYKSVWNTKLLPEIDPSPVACRPGANRRFLLVMVEQAHRALTHHRKDGSGPDTPTAQYNTRRGAAS